MAAYKFTVQRGKTDRGQIAIASGDAEAQSDTISVNIDVTNLRPAEVVMMLHKVIAKIEASPWPPLA